MSKKGVGSKCALCLHRVIACFEFMHALVYFNTITFNNTKSQYSITENMYSSGVVLAIQGATPRSYP